jgi:hypothetical protein
MPKIALDDTLNGVSGLFPTDIVSHLVEARYRAFPFRKLMGGFEKPIYRHQAITGNGTSFRVPKFYNLDYKNPRLTFEEKRNYEQKAIINQCEFTLDKQTFPVLVTDQQYMNLATPVASKIEPMIAKQFGMLSAKNLEWNILKSSTTGLYDVAVNGQMPRTERAQYGVVDYTYDHNATLPARLAAISNAFDATTKPTCAHILATKIKARKSATEDPINPCEINFVNGYDALEYWMLVSQTFYQLLVQDPEYISKYSGRGAILANQPNAIAGCDYVGKIEGVHVVVVPALDEFAPAANVAWSLFIGAGAWSVGWHADMKYGRDYDVIEDRLTLVTHETRGLGVLRYPAKTALANAVNTNIEHGIVHSFTRIA